MKVSKDSLRSARTALLGHAKGPSSPRLHSQQRQAVDTGGKMRRPRWRAVRSFPNLPYLPTEDKLPTNLLTCGPRGSGPRTLQLSTQGLPIGAEPQLGTANQRVHRQRPNHIQLDPRFALNRFPSTLQLSRGRICSPYHNRSAGANTAQDNLIFTRPRS